MTVPHLDVSATRADDGSVRVAVVNRHRDESVRLRLVLDGAADRTPRRARVRSLGGDVADVRTFNDLGEPDTIAVRDLGEVEASAETWTIPPHSVTVLALEDQAR